MESVARLRAERDMLAWLLTERDTEIHHLRELLHTAEQSEQRRIARELHDGLAQLTSAGYLQLQELGRSYRPRNEHARVAFQQALDCTRRAALEVRRMIAGAPPTELVERSLVDAIVREALALVDDGWSVTTALTNLAAMPATLELALFRIAQESLHNIRKHAGRCTVRVALVCVDTAIRLEIHDNGRGFDPARIPFGHFGLAGIRERVALLGGTVELWSCEGVGTRISVTVPAPDLAQSGMQ